ncbi:MAG: OmpA family protein [Candidatus Binatia bacterium]
MTSILSLFLILLLLGLQGCVATRDWVREQMSPVEGRVSNAEGRVDKLGGQASATETRLGQMGGRVTEVEGRLGQTDAKAERALSSLANLRLERRFVLELKEGANFAFNSAGLTDDAKRQIDGFFSDLKGDLKEADGAIFLVAGHTDKTGPEDYNYELGRKRANSVASYLITQKKIDPLKLTTVSYGPSAPRADNATREGRVKNRRVEILVYREGITTGTPEPASRAEPLRSKEPEERISSR